MDPLIHSWGSSKDQRTGHRHLFLMQTRLLKLNKQDNPSQL